MQPRKKNTIKSRNPILLANEQKNEPFQRGSQLRVYLGEETKFIPCLPVRVGKDAKTQISHGHLIRYLESKEIFSGVKVYVVEYLGKDYYIGAGFLKFLFPMRRRFSR